MPGHLSGLQGIVKQRSSDGDVISHLTLLDAACSLCTAKLFYGGETGQQASAGKYVEI